jgi:hypothetical protein
MRGGLHSIRSLALTLMVVAGACGGDDAPTDGDGGNTDAGVDTPTVDSRLIIDRDTADFGMVLIGNTSQIITFEITAQGRDRTGPLTAAVTGTGFRAMRDMCTGVRLNPGTSCTIAVDVTPASAGVITGTLTVGGDPGGDVTSALRVTGLAPGELMAMPATHPFGTITAGTMTAPATISFKNIGDAPTGIVVVQLGGPDATEFELVQNGCLAAVLDPDQSCDVMVRMIPPAASTGAKTAMITATATPGGQAVSTLTATVERPAILAINGSGAFGGLLLGTSASRTLMVTNIGAQPTGAVTITRTGNAAFQVQTGMANDCVSGTTTLLPGAVCEVRVTYTATVPGPVIGTITATATPGGSAMSSLTGTGQRPARLTGDLTQTFGNVEVATLSTNAIAWVITNAGDQASSVPMLTSANPELVVVSNGCTAAIPAGGNCTISLKYQPSAGGPRSATATVTINNGSMVTAAMSATGVFRLTLTRNGDAGRVTSNPVGLDCNAPSNTCVGLFAPGNVTLQARTTSGSFVYFGEWSGPAAGACAAGPGRDCTVTIDGPKAITASFLSMQFNLAFVSSTEQPTNLGGVAAYDALCNTLASAAGINDAGGTAFMAWMSDGGSSAIARLGNAAGWVRMDGRVVTLDRGTLVTTQRILNPVRFTELGEDPGDTVLMTGTNADGTVATGAHCSSWTSNAGNLSMTAGNGMGGPTLWASGQTSSCSASYRVLCMMKSYVAGPAQATSSMGNKMWLTNSAYQPSVTGDPDASCAADKPVGVAGGRALVARTGATAASLLAAGTMYVRPDGQEVGTGAEIVAGLARGGVWQQGNGAYWSGQAWTGSSMIDQLGTVNTNCGDWTISASSGRYTLPGLVRRFWGTTLPSIVCNNIPTGGPRLMCFEP